jgi:hypothetical protein
MRNTDNATPATRAELEAKLQKVLWRLKEVEWELRAMEEGWGGLPVYVDPAQYEHDPVAIRILMLARHRYSCLFHERTLLKGLANTIQRCLKEVQP